MYKSSRHEMYASNVTPLLKWFKISDKYNKNQTPQNIHTSYFKLQ